MKATILSAVILFSLAGPVPVVAEAPPSVAVAQMDQLAADVSASDTTDARQPCPMHGMGMKGKGMMGQAGKGPGGGKPGCDHAGRGQQSNQEQVLRRLDMIEARIAKIEVMLESLMQR